MLPKIIIVILLILFGAYLFFPNYFKNESVNKSDNGPIQITKNLGPVQSVKSDVNTYDYNSKGVKYTFNYPKDWKINDNFEETLVLTEANNESVQVKLTCPDSHSELPDPYKWEPNEGGITVRYFKKVSINNIESVQYLRGRNNEGGILDTKLIRKTDPVVCGFEMGIGDIKDQKFEEAIKAQSGYEYMINSFRFIE